MLVSSYPRDAPSTDLFFQDADEIADEELVAGFEAESYHVATSAAALPVVPDLELQTPWWDNVLSQAPAVDSAIHLQGCPTHGNVYPASCLG